MWGLTSPVTGATQTGFTSPTYTLAVDTPPAANAKQSVVTALGGTQAGVTVHSVGSPFTIACFRPVSFRYLGTPNPVTGVIANVPNNTYKVITRKGVIPLAGQPTRVASITSIIEVPAGSDVASPSELRGMFSAHIGSLAQQSAGLGDTAINGVL